MNDKIDGLLAKALSTNSAEECQACLLKAKQLGWDYKKGPSGKIFLKNNMVIPVSGYSFNEANGIRVGDIPELFRIASSYRDDYNDIKDKYNELKAENERLKNKNWISKLWSGFIELPYPVIYVCVFVFINFIVWSLFNF